MGLNVHAVTADVSSYVQLSCYILKTVFPLSYPLPLSLTLLFFLSSFVMIHDPWKARVQYTCSLYIFTFCSLLFLHFGQLWLSILVAIYCKWKLLWGHWEMHSSMNIITSHLELVYISKIVVIGPSLGLMTCLAIDSWPKLGCESVDFILWEKKKNLTSNQKIVGYSHNIVPPLHVLLSQWLLWLAGVTAG